MAEAHQAPIIIIKKKAHHDEHHGGAWKVAYADFVTAMMALFIVLWLLSSSEQVKKAVGGYFQDPTGKGRQTGSTNAGIGETLTLSKDNLQQIKEKIDMLMRQMPTFDRIKDQVKMTVTAEGLRIDLMETQGGMFFETGNPRPTKAGGDLITSLAQELAKLPNKIAIEGHTDSTPYGREDYSNWELSTDRANSARRLMQAQGLRPDQLNQVRGFADQRLMKPDDPTNPKNRRISIIVRSVEIDAQEDAGRALAAKAEGKSAEGKPAEGKPAEGKSPEAKPAAEPAKHH